jgi:cysteine desulfurase/selenocysteine lyase
MEAVREHEISLTSHLLKGLRALPEVKIYGNSKAEKRCGLVTFNIEINHEIIDAHLIDLFLNDADIAACSCGHCAYPLDEELGMKDTARVSFFEYNSIEEVNYFLDVLNEVINKKLK